VFSYKINISNMSII